MNSSLRKTVIAGNWKMNATPAEAEALISSLLSLTQNAVCEVILCVPYIDLPLAVEKTKGSKLHIGAQNCHWENSGAFTGEISPAMLSSLEVEYVILGHSERRVLFGETDSTVNQRVLAALRAGLKPIVCVGEVLEEREQGITQEVVRRQVKIALQSVTTDQLKQLVIAYEPVWAIGTGKTASAEQANEVCGQIRAVLAELYGESAAASTTIQYGGSMKASNAQELLSMEHVDGGLIGGASLKAEEFSAIVSAADTLINQA